MQEQSNILFASVKVINSFWKATSMYLLHKIHTVINPITKGSWIFQMLKEHFTVSTPFGVYESVTHNILFGDLMILSSFLTVINNRLVLVLSRLYVGFSGLKLLSRIHPIMIIYLLQFQLFGYDYSRNTLTIYHPWLFVIKFYSISTETVWSQ